MFLEKLYQGVVASLEVVSQNSSDVTDIVKRTCTFKISVCIVSRVFGEVLEIEPTRVMMEAVEGHRRDSASVNIESTMSAALSTGIRISLPAYPALQAALRLGLVEPVALVRTFEHAITQRVDLERIQYALRVTL